MTHIAAKPVLTLQDALDRSVPVSSKPVHAEDSRGWAAIRSTGTDRPFAFGVKYRDSSSSRDVPAVV